MKARIAVLWLRSRLAMWLVFMAFWLHNDSAQSHFRKRIGAQQLKKAQKNAKRRSVHVNASTAKYNPDV